MRAYVKIVPLVLFCCLSLWGYIFAQDNISIQDKMIGGTFKSLGKTFVAVSDIEQLKKTNIEKIRKMKDEKFKKKTSAVYNIIKELPFELKAKYRIKQNMNRADVISAIEGLDKKKIYEIIDAIPDTFIAKQFRLYLASRKQNITESNLAVQIKGIWDKIITKTRAPTNKR